MGEVAEMMLDGTLCEGCGEYLGYPVGYPRYCSGCAKDQHAPVSAPKNFRCKQCGKRFDSPDSKDQHIKDKHK